MVLRTIDSAVAHSRAACLEAADLAGVLPNYTITVHVDASGALTSLATVPRDGLSECLAQAIEAPRYPASVFGIDVTYRLPRGGQDPRD